jgi:hypothetical protein
MECPTDDDSKIDEELNMVYFKTEESERATYINTIAKLLAKWRANPTV